MQQVTLSQLKSLGVALMLCAALGACGGSGGGGGAPQADATTPNGASGSTPGTTNTDPVPQTDAAQIASVELAQSLLFPTSDSALVLVSNKDALVKVNVLAGLLPEPKPTANLRVETLSGALVQNIPLTSPTGALPNAVPDVPSFANSYTAVVPASLIQPNLRLTATLSNGQLSRTVIPRVGGGKSITIVAVPVQIGSTVAQAMPGVANYVVARMPMANATVNVHGVYTSTQVTTLPTTEAAWLTAFDKILQEINSLRLLEGASAQTYYFGFLPKRTFGLLGMGYMPGFAAVGFDMPSQSAAVLETLAHELGHNFNLAHAPCGNPASVDASYPYDNAQLGGGGRYIWGYNFITRQFIDPRKTDVHDAMSYCTGDTFSDYNYGKMQRYLYPTDLFMAGASAAFARESQELLLFSGDISAGKVSLQPVKTLMGQPELPLQGSYTLRIATAQGTVEYPFAPMQLDHVPDQQHFSFTIANPGTIVSISILKDGAVQLEKTATDIRARVATTLGVAKATPVQFTEQNEAISVAWDHARYPYLTVTYVGKERIGLAQDLQGGIATVSSQRLPDGGSLEFGLSDGVNSVRVVLTR